MLRAIQAGDLLLGGGTQAVGGLDDLEHDGHYDGCVGTDSHHTQQLDADQIKAAAIEQAAVSGQQTGENGTQHTADTVYGNGAHRIVHMELGVQDLNAQHHGDAGDDAHDHGAQGVQIGAAGGDAHQTGQRGVEAHTYVRLAVLDPGEQHTDHRSYSRRDGGVAQDLRHLLRIGGGGAVEAVPAEPQDEHAHSSQGNIVAQNGPGIAVLIILADAGAQHDGADQAGDTAHHVDDGGTGKVDEAQLSQPALTVPDPACLDGVDDGGDDGGVDAVAGELGALGHGAGHDGGGGGTEHQLEEEVRPVKGVEVGEQLVLRHTDKAEEIVLTVHDAVAQQTEDHSADAEVHQVLHDNVAGVLGPGKAAFRRGEARLHKEHQNRAD